MVAPLPTGTEKAPWVFGFQDYALLLMSSISWRLPLHRVRPSLDPSPAVEHKVALDLEFPTGRGRRQDVRAKHVFDTGEIP